MRAPVGAISSSGTTAVPPEWQAARRVLVVRLDNLGDVLLTTPAMRALRQSLPRASLTLLASEVGAQVGRLDPDLDDVIVYAAPWMDPWQTLPLDPAREAGAIAAVAAGEYDAAVIFTSFRQSPLPAAYLCYLAGIPLRLAASIDGPGSLLTTRHRHPERMMHEVERGLDLVAAIGAATDDDRLVLQVPPEARDDAARFVDAPRPLVVVHPGCSMPARTYPWEQYAAVISRLPRDLEARIVVTGAEHERDLVAAIVGEVDERMRERVIPAAGALSFAGLCALIDAADLTITNNTGPMHIAAAVGTPVVALFALTNPPQQWGPWRVPHRLLSHDVPCRLCYSRVCPTRHDCLRLVTPEMVVAASVELLDEVGGRKSEVGREGAHVVGHHWTTLSAEQLSSDLGLPTSDATLPAGVRP
ncbi:MAG: glycosyltransferase family 9 protein [Thermomicrobiales bacterium]